MTIVAETDSGCLFGGSSLGNDKSGKSGKRKKYNKYSSDNNNNSNDAYYEEVGRKAARELITDWKSTKEGCTDRWLQDQLPIFMALAKGKSRMKTCALELHTETAIFIAQLLTGVKFDVSKTKDGTVLIECEGIGYRAKHFEDENQDETKKNDDDNVNKNDDDDTS
eukprot:47286_1